MENVALPYCRRLLRFQPHGKCAGWGGHLASSSDIFVCDVFCTSQLSLQAVGVQSTNEQLVLISMNVGILCVA